MSDKEVVIIMNLIKGKNLYEMIFGKERTISRVGYTIILCVSINISSTQQATSIQKLYIAKEIAQGIKFMHTRDPVIIHQDIKPLNVMVRQHSITTINK